MKKLILLYLWLFTQSLIGANDSSFVLMINDTIGQDNLSRQWKYNTIDNIQFADTLINDTNWPSSETNFSPDEINEKNFRGITWFRTFIIISESHANTPIAIILHQQGGSEIYIDGKLIKNFGKPSDSKNTETRINPNGHPFIFSFSRPGKHLIAVRYSNNTALEKQEKYYENTAGFTFSLASANDRISNFYEETLTLTSLLIFLFTFFLTLAFVHFLLFLFYKAGKSNFYYSAFLFIFSLFFLFPFLLENNHDPDSQSRMSFYLLFIIPTFFIALLGFIYSLFYPKMPKIYWILLIILFIILIFKALRLEPGIVSFSFICATTIISAIEVVKAFLKRKKGVWAIGIAAISFLSLIIIILLKNALGFGNSFVFNGSDPEGLFIIALLLASVLGIPVSMSVFLAREFALTSNNLSKKLIEVEELSFRTIEQEKEKQKILANQKEILEEQVIERTQEIVEQKKLIEEKNKDITDSIIYAKRIQEAMLPELSQLQKHFPEGFGLYIPKDVVSGDFYWFNELNGLVYFAVADCTGHGVPGAFMSMIGIDKLNQSLIDKKIEKPSDILKNMNNSIKNALKQNNIQSGSKDGMDIVLCSYDKEKQILQFAGANRPLWLIRNNELTEHKPDKLSIAGYTEFDQPYRNNVVKVQKGDCIYAFTDGIVDQFGGPDGKKFMSKRMKELLLNIHSKPMHDQEQLLKKAIEEWKGKLEQIDDILVFGMRI